MYEGKVTSIQDTIRRASVPLDLVGQPVINKHHELDFSKAISSLVASFFGTLPFPCKKTN